MSEVIHNLYPVYTAHFIRYDNNEEFYFGSENIPLIAKNIRFDYNGKSLYNGDEFIGITTFGSSFLYTLNNIKCAFHYTRVNDSTSYKIKTYANRYVDVTLDNTNEIYRFNFIKILYYFLLIGKNVDSSFETDDEKTFTNPVLPYFDLPVFYLTPSRLNKNEFLFYEEDSSISFFNEENFANSSFFKLPASFYGLDFSFYFFENYGSPLRSELIGSSYILYYSDKIIVLLLKNLFYNLILDAKFDSISDFLDVDSLATIGLTEENPTNPVEDNNPTNPTEENPTNPVEDNNPTNPVEDNNPTNPVEDFSGKFGNFFKDDIVTCSLYPRYVFKVKKVTILQNNFNNYTFVYELVFYAKYNLETKEIIEMQNLSENKIFVPSSFVSEV